MNQKIESLQNKVKGGRIKIVFATLFLFLYFGCALDSGDQRGQSVGNVSDKKGDTNQITLRGEYKDGFAVLIWEPAVPVKIKMKYEEGSKTDWQYLSYQLKVGEEKDQSGETVARYQESDLFDSGKVQIPVSPDNLVLFQVESADGVSSGILELRTLSDPSIYISSYKDLTFRLEVSVPPYAQKVIVERRGEDTNWEKLKEISVDDDVKKSGKFEFEDKVESEGVWFYRARAINNLGDSGYSREFFASPVVCLSARSSPRIRGKSAGCGWAYRRVVTVTNSSTPEKDVVVRVTLNTAALISGGKMKADCSDVRFTDQTDEIFIPYWIGINRLGQSTCNTSATVFWVKIPYLPSGANSIYMYYGNENADAVSDPNKVFVFYDNAESYTDGQRPPPGWTHIGSGILEAHNDGGNMVIMKGCANTASGCSPTGGGDYYNGGERLFPYPVSNFIAMWRFKRVNTADTQYDLIYLHSVKYDGYSFIVRTTDDGIWIQRFDNGNFGANIASGTAPGTTDTGEWQMVVFYKRGSNITGEFTHANGSQTLNATDANHVVFDRVAIRGSRDAYFDDIAVAKYADVSVSVGVETSASYTGLFLRRIPITLNSTFVLRDFEVVFELPLTLPITLDTIRNDCGDLRFSDSPYFEVDLWNLSFPYYFEARGPCGGDPTLLSWWEFNETSGTSASDSSGNGNTGTLSGASWGGGIYGGGVNLVPDGTTDFVTIPGTVLDGRTSFSISVWVRWTKGDNGGPASIISAATSGSPDELLIYKLTTAGNDTIQVHVKNTAFNFPAGVNIEDGSWHHIVFVRGATNGNGGWLYVDGVLRAARGDLTTGALNVICTVIGQETDSISGTSCAGFSAAEDWEGYIDDLRIFNRELAPYEVRMLYEGRSRVWVKIPYITAGTSTLYAYFGNTSKASISSGDRTFEFFDEFPGNTVDTTKWNANSSNYTVSNGVVVRTGNLVSRYAVAHSNVGRAFEILTRWWNSSVLYAGINIADDDRTSGSNTQADCLAYWMTEAGDSPVGNTEHLTIWGAEGDSASYDIFGGATLHTITEFIWYIGGFRFNSSQFIYYINNALYTSLASQTASAQWRGGLLGGGDKTPEQEPGAPYLFLGDFQGLNSPNTNDIDDIEVRWVRVRKDGTQPAVSYGAIEDSTE